VECGKFHAAGIATGAGRVWLSRLAGILIVWWVGFLLAAVAMLGLAMFVLDVVSVETFSRYTSFNGPPGARTWGFEEAPLEYFGSAGAYWLARGIVIGISIIVGWALGAFPTVFVAHVQRWWWAAMAVVPLAVGGFVLFITIGTGSHYLEVTWPIRAIGTQTAVHVMSLLLGVATGRTVARGFLRVVLTRKLLQHVGFWWRVDGRETPGPRGA
jgi:hypothetical protein